LYMTDRFGFGRDIVDRAVLAGHADASMVTLHSPATAFGSRLWEGAIRQLRDELIPRGWRSLRPGQLEVVRNKLETIQITAALGDINVGDPAASPSCEHPRGTSTARAIEVNQNTFAGLAPGDGWEPIETWWLLYRPSKRPDQPVRCELSLPVSMAGSRIRDWAIRILLSGFDERSGETAILPESPAPIDVPLNRRVG